MKIAIAHGSHGNGASEMALQSMSPSQPLPASPSIIYGADNKPPIPQRPFSDPNRLAPEDAFYTHSSPRRQRHNDQYLALDGEVAGDSTSVRSIGSTRRKRGKDRGRSGSRRGKGVWKKLLWVKQKDCMHYSGY